MGFSPTLLVAAGVIIEGARVLLTQRKRGAHLEGAWEFPGGKVEPGEDPRDALVRELREEVGIAAEALEIVDLTFHRYPRKAILLMFFEARRLEGSPEPRALDVAAVRWATVDELRDDAFPPADLAVLRKVRAMLHAKTGARVGV